MTTSTAPSRAEAVPPGAVRSRRPGWRNLRLLAGLALVAASVLVGARLLAAADDTVGVWAVVRDLPAGATLAATDLERREVRFTDQATARAYVGAADPVAAGATLGRPVRAGELLPRGALDAEAAPGLVDVPVGVLADDLPATVRQGSVVDVWVTPEGTGQAPSRAAASPVLRGVTVLAVPRPSDGFAPQATRQLIVGVPAADADDLGAALGGLAGGRVVIVRVG